MHDLAGRFLEEHVPAHCKPSSAHSYEIAIRQHVLPRLGNRRVADVTRGEVAALHHRMHATPYAANRTLGILSAMFTAAELWGLRPQGSNPCRYVKRFRERRRERFLSDGEYRRLGAVLREAEGTGTVATSAIAAIRLLMLTGCRLASLTPWSLARGPPPRWMRAPAAPRGRRTFERPPGGATRTGRGPAASVRWR